MVADMTKSFGTLQAELELAKSNLKGLNENIKRIIGRDPTDGPLRIGVKRNANGAAVDDYPSSRSRSFNNRNRYDDDVIPDKRRANDNKSVFSRLSGFTQRAQKYHSTGDSYNPEEYDNPEEYYPQDFPKPKVQSRVIRELPSREEVLAAQGDDEKSRGRSRRIFGSLLGTLQKFKQDESRLKSKDERKAEIERKVEEQASKEREEIKKARQDLFQNRKKKQAEIRAIEVKMNRMKEYTKWEESMKPLFGFIQLKGKPPIYYKPKIMNDATNALLKCSNENLEHAIDKKRQEVYSELEEIESKIMGNYMDESYSSKDKEARQDESDDVIMADMQESASQDVDVPVDETPMEQNQHLSPEKETAEQPITAEEDNMKAEIPTVKIESDNVSDPQVEKLLKKEETLKMESDPEC